MSYFDTDKNTSTTTQDVNTEANQEQPNQENNEDWVNKIVKVKGENFKDPQVMAKSILHSTTHIEGLERQLEELRNDLSKQDYAKNLLDEVRKQSEQSPSGGEVSNGTSQTNSTTSTENGGTTREISEEMLKGLIETTLTNREAANTAKQNLKITDEKLTQLYGTEVGAKMQEVSQSLGMPKERLQDIAAESPTAFFKLLGEKVEPAKTSMINQGSVNTSTSFMDSNASSKRDRNYYKKLRQDNPKTYYDPKIQRQMFADVERLGDSFYS